MIKRMDLPPSCSTGVTNTDRPGLYVVVDWLSVTFKSFETWQEISQLFNINTDLFSEVQKGILGYENMVEYNHIKILWGGFKDNKYAMGIHVIMSGQGCREYEKLMGEVAEQYYHENFSWSDLFYILLTEECKITRLDIAIDDFKGYLNLKTITSKIEKGCLCSKLKKAINYQEYSIADGNTIGQTIYIGNSDVQFRFYNKLLERRAKGILYDGIIFWQRYELQLKKDRAIQCAKYIAQEMNVGEVIVGIYRYYLDFKVKGKTDTNKSRWKTCKWWFDFIHDIKGLKLTEQAPENTILKKYLWMQNQTTKSMAMLSQIFSKEQLLDYFVTLGQENITEKEQKQIEDFVKYNKDLIDKINDVQKKELSQKRKAPLNDN